MTKRELRKLYIAKREALSDKDYLEYNEQICDTFFQSVDLSQVKHLHIFLPMIRKREVDTMMIIDRLQEAYPLIKIAVPRMKSNSELESYYYEGPSQLMINSWGIQEPKEGELVDPTHIDVTIVPLLAFDLQGQRVGYGKGYYDDFLAQCRADCRKIGVSMFDPERKIEDASLSDVQLDQVITTRSVFDF